MESEEKNSKDETGDGRVTVERADTSDATAVTWSTNVLAEEKKNRREEVNKYYEE